MRSPDRPGPPWKGRRSHTPGSSTKSSFRWRAILEDKVRAMGFTRDIRIRVYRLHRHLPWWPMAKGLLRPSWRAVTCVYTCHLCAKSFQFSFLDRYALAAQLTTSKYVRGPPLLIASWQAGCPFFNWKDTSLAADLQLSLYKVIDRYWASITGKIWSSSPGKILCCEGRGMWNKFVPPSTSSPFDLYRVNNDIDLGGILCLSLTLLCPAALPECSSKQVTSLHAFYNAKA